MRVYSFLHALYLSFFSRDLYRDVGRRWPGVGLLYLLFLLAIAWLPLMFKLHFDFGRKLQQLAPQLVKDLPRISVTKGVVDTDPPGRHEIKDPDTGKTFAIIDASIESINLDELPDDVIILTRSKFIMKQSDRRQTRIQDLSSVENFSMDRNDAERWLRAAGRWMAVLLYPFMLLGSYVYRIVQLLFYALIGLALARGAVPYPKLMRLTAVAVTPAVLVDTLVGLTPLEIPLWWLICFLVAMFYLDFALRALREPELALPGYSVPPPPTPPVPPAGPPMSG